MIIPILASAFIAFWLGFLFGKALLRFQLEQEGYFFDFDPNLKLGQGRYQIRKSG